MPHLIKTTETRECFIARNNSLIEFDISAYHPTLLAKLVGYDFGDQDIHMAFAEMYGVDYKKAKELTFKQLYGGVFEQYKDLEFLKKFKYILTICGINSKMKVTLNVLFLNIVLKKMS